MDVRCETCGTEYEFDAARIGPQGVKVKCTACQSIFIVHSNTGASAAVSKTNWLVRTSDDRLIAFEKLTTLQKWIIEGRIERDDEISKDSESWKRLGNVQELEPFFSVFDRASALNDLMNTGAVGDHPVLVNGSEVLATANPLNTGRPSTRPSSNQPQSLIETHQIPAAERRPSSIKRQELSTPPEHPASFANPESEASTNPDHKAKAPPAPTARQSSFDALSPNTDLDTGLAGPGALNDFGLGNEVEPDEFVRTFERKSRFKRRALAMSSILLGGLIGGATFAIYGFPKSPISKIKDWQTKEKTASPRSQSLVEEARRQLEKDTLISIKAANNTYLKALEEKPKQSELLAGRALVLTTWADSLRRKARDNEKRLSVFQERQQAYEEALETYKNTPLKAQAKLQMPQPPSPADAKSLRTSINQSRTQASGLTREAFDLLRNANDNGAPSIATLRALANYYRVQRDKKANAYLEQAKAMAQATETRDPLTMYIEAAAMTTDIDEMSAAKRDKAARMLEDVLTLRPTLIRARVLLARILAAQSSSTFAKENLKRVLKESPGHTEAKELLTQLENVPAAKQKTVVPKSPIAKPTPIAEKASPRAETSKSKARTQKQAIKKGYNYYLGKGKKLRKNNNPWKALHAYEKAARIKKSAAAPYIGIGWCYLELGKPIAARNQFKKASMVQATSLDAQHGMGMALMAQGKVEEALPYLERVIDWAPKSRAARKARRTIEEIRDTE